MSFSDDRGFDYFVEIPSDEWDARNYHEAWKAKKFPLTKTVITTTFNQQVDWLLLNGTPKLRENATNLQGQFKLAAGLRLLRGLHQSTLLVWNTAVAASRGTSSPARPLQSDGGPHLSNVFDKIDIRKGGRVFTFWEQVVHTTQIPESQATTVSLSNKRGFEYFVETPTDEWDVRDYHESWKAKRYPLMKSVLTRTFNHQVDWLMLNSSFKLRTAATSLKEQFQIDSKKGGRVFTFWEQVMFVAKQNDIKMKATKQIPGSKQRKDHQASAKDDEVDDLNIKDLSEETPEKVEAGKKSQVGHCRLSALNRQEIETVYSSMAKENMWKLSNGKFVEEELYKLGLELESEHGVHSFIVDVEDEAIKRHFSGAEILELENSAGPQAPELSQDIIDYLAKYIDKTTVKEVRKTINDPDKRFDVEYNPDIHHDLDYIRFALYALVREIENGGLKDQNLEAWFNCHVWNVVVDQGFADLKGTSVVRGESISLANSNRKNSQRMMTDRRVLGHRGDWILRGIGNGDRDEYGLGEAGKSWVDEHGTKFMRETCVKVPKILKDMLLKLMKKVDYNKELCYKLQTVGIIHAGMIVMIIRLDNPYGYICRVRRGNLMQVPDVQENIPNVLPILAAVLNLKAIVKETIKAASSKPILSTVQVAEMFKQAGVQKRPRNRLEIPSCMSTPKKPKASVRKFEPSSNRRLQLDDDYDHHED